MGFRDTLRRKRHDPPVACDSVDRASRRRCPAFRAGRATRRTQSQLPRQLPDRRCSRRPGRARSRPALLKASSGTRARRRDSESSGERFKVQFRTRALIPASYRDRRQVLLLCARTLPESRRCLRPGARMPHRGAGRRIVLAVAGCPGGLVRGRTARPRLGAQTGAASAVSRRGAAARSLALTTQNASTTAGSNCVPEQRRSSVSASLALRPAL